MILGEEKEKVPISPNVPSERPRQVLPNDWAASSSSGFPLFLHISTILCMSDSRPVEMRFGVLMESEISAKHASTKALAIRNWMLNPAIEIVWTMWIKMYISLLILLFIVYSIYISLHLPHVCPVKHVCPVIHGEYYILELYRKTNEICVLYPIDVTKSQYVERATKRWCREY